MDTLPNWHKIKRAVILSIPLKFGTHNIARKEATFNILHTDAACKLGHVGDHALHVQCPKLGFSLVGFPGETKDPSIRVLLGAFSIVLSHFTTKIYLDQGYTAKWHFPQGNLI